MGTERRATVILVHGLWGTDLGLRCLGRRIARTGMAVTYYRYASWRDSLETSSRGLRELIRRSAGGAVHLLGHSMGGIVIARMLEGGSPPEVGKVALLGTPIRGSAVITALSGNPVGRFLIGAAAREGIVENRPPAPTDRPLLVVAGTFPLGIGLLFRLPRPNDGWIQVSETRIEGAGAILSGAWHFGLLFSRKVAGSVCAVFQGETGNPGGPRG
jgi:pimeloyl-ACP methyl ester carboxylesterase